MIFAIAFSQPHSLDGFHVYMQVSSHNIHVAHFTMFKHTGARKYDYILAQVSLLLPDLTYIYLFHSTSNLAEMFWVMEIKLPVCPYVPKLTHQNPEDVTPRFVSDR